MRRITMINWISVDGFFAGPNGELDWIVRDPEVDKALHEPGGDPSPSGGSDTMLLGNMTYTMFENSWPQVAKDPNAPQELHKLAEEVISMTKIVFSQTRENVTWENSVLYKGNLVEEVRKLKQAGGAPIVIFGSGSLVQQLTDAALIDEYFLAVTPVVLGQGKPLFRDIRSLRLSLLEARSFRSGNVLLRYARSESA